MVVGRDEAFRCSVATLLAVMVGAGLGTQDSPEGVLNVTRISRVRLTCCNSQNKQVEFTWFRVPLLNQKIPPKIWGANSENYDGTGSSPKVR